MPDEGAPLYLKRVTAIISMCNLWCHLWYYRHLPKLAPWSFRPPKLRPKELLTLHAHEPTNTLFSPRQIPGVKLRLAPCLYSYRGLASPIMVEDPRELASRRALAAGCLTRWIIVPCLFLPRCAHGSSGTGIRTDLFAGPALRCTDTLNLLKYIQVRGQAWNAFPP
ncbi:hypothetical protein CI102_13196 [Trichoderma harzianum]|uniref:Uncharacterized protein n=1 Tax=Trichoderma harzianum CBS 226.95 TaxID=983964 RepID=A0A2T4AIL6_TRIHA|nr:hypothetical protein M431DRAFT_388574 [Trichoderma harzianum CBS 226.95]PKK42444.1 hypothetical protein CI102_13196 [Trichoderma harzianum]PTB56887.1 hypothetical protein M431DRAFT_388574 [Trichoderma harzianum CBS 226.95]